jgi:phosphatidylserine decarboxylase
MDRDAWRFVGPTLVIALIGIWTVARGSTWGWTLIGVGAVAAVAFTLFFRDPQRTAPGDPDAILATADGRIVTVATHPDGCTQIDTFLSVWNVHVNRAPVAGTVVESQYRPGRFLAAYRPEASTENERHDLAISTDQGTVRAAQIAGVLARRVVCRVGVGDSLRQGQKIGLIRFGSRASVIVPPGFVIAVSPGDRVRAGVTAIARRRRTAVDSSQGQCHA